MDEEQLQEILNNPTKMLNLIRAFHQFLHLLDKQEMEKQLEKRKGGTNEAAGLGDSISIVLKDDKGIIKKEVEQ